MTNYNPNKNHTRFTGLLLLFVCQSKFWCGFQFWIQIMGIIVRNNDGQVIGVWTKTYLASSFVIEVLACLRVIQFTSEMGFRLIEIETDSQSIINKLYETKEDNSWVSAYIWDAKIISKSFEQGNTVAHSLAKECFNRLESTFWVEEAPISIMGDRWCGWIHRIDKLHYRISSRGKARSWLPATMHAYSSDFTDRSQNLELEAYLIVDQLSIRSSAKNSHW